MFEQRYLSVMFFCDALAGPMATFPSRTEVKSNLQHSSHASLVMPLFGCKLVSFFKHNLADHLGDIPKAFGWTNRWDRIAVKNKTSRNRGLDLKPLDMDTKWKMPMKTRIRLCLLFFLALCCGRLSCSWSDSNNGYNKITAKIRLSHAHVWCR